MKDFSEYLLDLAYECIEVDGRHLGDNIIPNTSINTSSWISHSLYMAKAAENLAKKLGMNAKKQKHWEYCMIMEESLHTIFSML